MKISMSKKLKNIGILDEIEMIAAWKEPLDLIDEILYLKSSLVNSILVFKGQIWQKTPHFIPC